MLKNNKDYIDANDLDIYNSKKLTAEQAMDALKIPKSEQSVLIKKSD